MQITARAPSPSNFGLSDELLALANRREKSLQARFSQVYLAGALALAIFALVKWVQEQNWSNLLNALAAHPFESVVILALGTPVWIACGLVILLFAFAIYSGLFKALKAVAAHFDPLLRALFAYRTAMEQFENWKRKATLEFWRSLRAQAFEHELARLFRAVGYRAQVTPASGDHGIDIELSRNGERTIVQCKGHARPIGPGAARELLGTLQAVGAKCAILASPSGFTSGVRDLVRGTPIELLDLQGIIELVDQAASNAGRSSTRPALQAGADYATTPPHSEAGDGSSDTETFVPWHLMREGWTAEYPKCAKNWSPERDVFTWLNPRRSIEDVMVYYHGRLDNHRREKQLNLLERLSAYMNKWTYGTCHHGKNTWIHSCPECARWDEECLAYLSDLRRKVRLASGEPDEFPSRRNDLGSGSGDSQ